MVVLVKLKAMVFGQTNQLLTHLLQKLAIGGYVLFHDGGIYDHFFEVSLWHYACLQCLYRVAFKIFPYLLLGVFFAI